MTDFDASLPGRATSPVSDMQLYLQAAGAGKLPMQRAVSMIGSRYNGMPQFIDAYAREAGVDPTVVAQRLQQSLPGGAPGPQPGGAQAPSLQSAASSPQMGSPPTPGALGHLGGMAATSSGPQMREGGLASIPRFAEGGLGSYDTSDDAFMPREDDRRSGLEALMHLVAPKGSGLAGLADPNGPPLIGNQGSALHQLPGLPAGSGIEGLFPDSGGPKPQNWGGPLSTFDWREAMPNSPLSMMMRPNSALGSQEAATPSTPPGAVPSPDAAHNTELMPDPLSMPAGTAIVPPSGSQPSGRRHAAAPPDLAGVPQAPPPLEQRDVGAPPAPGGPPGAEAAADRDKFKEPGTLSGKDTQNAGQGATTAPSSDKRGSMFSDPDTMALLGLASGFLGAGRRRGETAQTAFMRALGEGVGGFERSGAATQQRQFQQEQNQAQFEFNRIYKQGLLGIGQQKADAADKRVGVLEQHWKDWKDEQQQASQDRRYGIDTRHQDTQDRLAQAQTNAILRQGNAQEKETAIKADVLRRAQGTGPDAEKAEAFYQAHWGSGAKAPADDSLAAQKTAHELLKENQDYMLGDAAKQQKMRDDMIAGRRGTPAAATTPQFENGKTYTDKAGNKALYQDGNWIPQ